MWKTVSIAAALSGLLALPAFAGVVQDSAGHAVAHNAGWVNGLPETDGMNGYHPSGHARHGEELAVNAFVDAVRGSHPKAEKAARGGNVIAQATRPRPCADSGGRAFGNLPWAKNGGAADKASPPCDGGRSSPAYIHPRKGGGEAMFKPSFIGKPRSGGANANAAHQSGPANVFPSIVGEPKGPDGASRAAQGSRAVHRKCTRTAGPAAMGSRARAGQDGPTC